MQHILHQLRIGHTPIHRILPAKKYSTQAFRSLLISLFIGLTVWAVFALFMGLIQFSTPDMPDNDGFYHIKLAYLMRTEGLKPAFPWLPLSILNPREFYDHHFLFHVALIPFTFGDLRLGAKWASVIFASLAFFCIWRLLRNQRVPFAFLWALGLLAVSEAFLFRMSITRAQSLSLAVLAVGLDWLLRRHYRRLVFLGFFYVWLYNAFPLLLILAGVVVAAELLVERRLDLRPLFFTGAGIAAGLIINPYFPYNIVFAYQHFLPKLVETTAVSVGSEWYPYDTSQLLTNSFLALAAWIAGTLALGLTGKRMDVKTAASFGLACLFAGMLFQSRRFIEYFPAFALIFAAFAWSPLIDNFRRHPSVGRWTNHPMIRRFAPQIPALVLLSVLIPALWGTFQAAQASIQRSKPFGLYAGASAWLEANTPTGARVFQTDWDDFPRLFFYNTRNTYLTGLDPTYMQLYDAGLYDSWVRITQGNVAQPSVAIASTFGAQYVVTDLQHSGFLSQAAADPGLAEVYRDGEAVVYRVGVKEGME
jgi:hypothetical protein